MTTEVIYARVPAETKHASEGYAEARGLTLAAALSELLSKGLAATEDEQSVAALQTRVRDLEHAVRNAELARAEAVLETQRAEQRLQSLRQAADAWVQRAELRVGTCPACQGALLGRDLLVSGRCGACGTSIGGLLEPKTSQIESRDLMLVLGAAGLILGLIAISRGGAS